MPLPHMTAWICASHGSFGHSSPEAAESSTRLRHNFWSRDNEVVAKACITCSTSVEFLCTRGVQQGLPCYAQLTSV